MSGPAHINCSGFAAVFCRNRTNIAASGLSMPVSVPTDHILHFGNHPAWLKRLPKKPAVGGDIDVRRLQLTGHHHDLDRHLEKVAPRGAAQSGVDLCQESRPRKKVS
jgi:hypothetical protein